MGCFDPFWLPKFHPFPHHWRSSLAKQSPMTFTDVEDLITTGRQWDSTVFNDAEEVGNLGNHIESKQPFLFYSV